MMKMMDMHPCEAKEGSSPLVRARSGPVLWVVAAVCASPGMILAGHPGAKVDGGAPLQLAVADPQEVARTYLSAVERMAWGVVTDQVHPEAAEDFRRYVEIMLFQGVDPAELVGREGETTTASGLPLAEALEAVSGVGSVASYLELDDRVVLREALQGLQRASPGMINAWVDRSTEVLGVVPEGDTLRHVVYRLEWGISGARADIEVMTLAPGPNGKWLVRTARELESLRPAISAIFRRAPPDGAGMMLDSSSWPP